MWPEDDVVEAKQIPARPQFHLHGVFGDSVRIFRRRQIIFAHRRRGAAVHRNRRGEHEQLDAVVDGGIQQVHAAYDVVRVVEALDEVTQAFGGIRGEVVDVIEALFGEQPVDQRVINHAAADECGCRRYVLAKAATQVVEDRDVMAARDQGVRHVGADKPGPTGQENSAHWVRWYPGSGIRDPGRL
jgi:hypothetical protein